MPDSQSPTPSTLFEAWKLHPTRRKEWSEIINSDVGTHAFAIIREKAFEPKEIPLAGHACSLVEYSALMNQRREGYLDCLRNILGLAKVSPFVAPPNRPWDSPGKDQRLQEMERDLQPPEDTRLPNSPVKTPPPVSGPAPVPASTTVAPETSPTSNTGGTT